MYLFKRFSCIILSVILSLNAIAADEKQQAAKNEERIIALETVGTLSSSNLYLAYLSLTLIKKNIDNGFFDKQFREIMDPVEHTLGLITTQLNKLKKISNLSDDDMKIISDIEKACTLLKEDTALLKQYLVSKSDTDNKAFVAKHNETGAFLEKLFKGGEEENEEE